MLLSLRLRTEIGLINSKMSHTKDLENGIRSLINNFEDNPSKIAIFTYNFYTPSTPLVQGLTQEGVLYVIKDKFFQENPSAFGVSECQAELMHSQVTGNTEQSQKFSFIVQEVFNAHNFKKY